MIFVLDNYDSFTYNLVHLLYVLGAEVEVVRNREITVAEVLSRGPAGLVYSPGPGTPDRAGILEDLIRAASERGLPQLGVCLGHQGIGEVFGARVVPAKHIRHGKVSPVAHDKTGIFAGMPSPLRAVRYHSLALDAESLPDQLLVTARTDDADAEIMGIRHAALPIFGIQYHPESLMTSCGRAVLENFLEIAHRHAGESGVRSC